MGLDKSDQLPQNITLSDAYQSVRKWYQTNIKEIERKGGDYATRSVSLIRALPDAASDLETRAVLGEVIYGNLEWAYHQSDGKYKMAAYAHAALKSTGHDFRLSDEDKTKLKGSKLWPHLSINR